MSCNHHTSQLSVRERLAFSSPESLERAYLQLRQRFDGCEFVILSTCNRVELYAGWDDSVQTELATRPSLRPLAQFLAEFHAVPLDEFVGELEERTDEGVVLHLFEVVSSLHSMVLGEPQIVTQVKEAYRAAELQQSCGPLTHGLFQAAIRASSRVRTETRLAEGRVSIASVAVGEFGMSIFDSFEDKQVLVIGAGEMAEETLRYLQDAGAKKLVVVNRNFERAERLASDWNGQAFDWSTLETHLGQADVVVSTTGSSEPIVTRERFQKATKLRPAGRTMFILDLAAPRDFEAAVGQERDVFLYDIDSLRQTCERNRKARHREIETAREIVRDEANRFLVDLKRRGLGGVVTRLREDWHTVSQQEMNRLFAKLSHLEERDRLLIEQTIERIVNKLLHPPLEVLKDEVASGTHNGLLDALKRLFRIAD